MMNPTPPATWSPSGSATSSTRAAFATLERRQRRLLEAVVFEGASCTQLARSVGATATDVRHEIGAAMLALYAQLAPPDRVDGGAVAAMLVLRALDALDPDETELIDVMLLHQPALQRTYAGYEDLVGELCALAPRSTPAPGVRARLFDAIDDDAN
jgi:hypothetical protein